MHLPLTLLLLVVLVGRLGVGDPVTVHLGFPWPPPSPPSHQAPASHQRRAPQPLEREGVALAASSTSTRPLVALQASP